MAHEHKTHVPETLSQHMAQGYLWYNNTQRSLLSLWRFTSGNMTAVIVNKDIIYLEFICE